MLAQLFSYSIQSFLIVLDGRLAVSMSDIRGDNQDPEKGKRQNGDSHKIFTATGAFSENEQAENKKLDATITSTFKNQHNQNFSKNIKSVPKRSIPIRHYKQIQKVEEKVVQEKSIRTRSPRRRRATLLHFAPINELPNVARVQLLLSNISERPLQFRLKSEPGPDISALPSAKGHINAHGSAKCTLTWRREANVEKWSDAQQPKMLLVLDFLHDKTKNEKHTLTRLIGKVVSGQTCNLDKPPVEQLMLDAATDEYSRLTSRELIVFEQASSLRKEPEEKAEAKLEEIVNSIIDWLNQQSKNSLLGLLLLIIFFYFLGIISSYKRNEDDEFLSVFSCYDMEKKVEIYPHASNNNNSVEILDETILTLKRCLALTKKGSADKCDEETDKIKKEQTETEKIVTEQVGETNDAQVTQCTIEGCIQNGSVAEAESQTIVSSIKIRRIHIVEYENEYQMVDIMRLITKVLSEPYSIYTYRYFIHNWPKLCLLALDLNDDKYVGAIVCKLDLSRENRRRGYIAMLAVDESCRKMGIGTRLVQKAISNMQEMGCDQVVLETEVTNTDALRLYSNLGFIREKRLFRYYLNGVDAYRLKLFLTTINESLLLDPPMFLGKTQCVP